MPRFSECWRCGNTVGIGISCKLCGVAKYCSEKCQKNDIFRHEAECIPASIHRTCTACRKSGPNLRACTGCYQAHYCNANCQKNNWERHKIDCLEAKKSVEATSKLILANYVESSEDTMATCHYFYWGNVPAIDCLNLIENESEAYGFALKVLHLGVGDLRNVALTCVSLPDSYNHKVFFTLNDRESCVLARIVLLLYIMNGDESDIEKTVVEIWYSTILSEETYQRLHTSLLELTGLTSAENLQSNTAGLLRVEESQFQQLQDVWKTWLGLRVTGTKWIRKQREDMMKTEVQLHSSYIENITVQHAVAAKIWMEQGVFRRTPGPAFAENPTMTGVDSKARYAPYSYSIPPNVFPFSGWDYLQVKKFKNCNCLVTMYGDYIECVLRNVLKRLSKQQISIQVILSNCMDVQQHLEVNTLYDRILTSNLMDYVFLPNLLKLCSEMLNHDNDHATIITETMLWSEAIMPEGDFSWPLNLARLPKFTKIALEDTKRTLFANDGGISVREYLDNSREFFNYLRAMFYAYRLNKVAKSKTTGSSEKSTIPGIKELANEFKLHLRDGIRNENRIVFHKPAINRRRVNLIMGRERYLEWIPLKKK